MCNAGVSTFGPNNTPITTIRNTAMSSWDGFVYQGVCALYVALLTIKNDFVGSKDYKLSLEGYEDFVIQNGGGQILSFHQCKSYATPADFTEEYKKMEDKRAYWNKKGICDTNAPLYFHCNQSLTYSHGVQPYTYHNGTDIASPVGIYGLVKEMIYLILQAQNIPASHLLKTAQLIYLIDRHVSWLHEHAMTLTSGMDGFDFVVANPITFKSIIDILTDTSTMMGKLEQARCIRYYFQMLLEERMVMHPHTNDGRVKDFIALMDGLDANQLLDLMQRLSPDVRMDRREAEREMVAGGRPNNLYQVLTETLQELKYPDAKWVRDGEIFSPSTLGTDLYTDEQSAKIVSNYGVASLLWDCRWIVGNVKTRVDDVRDEAKKIMTIPIDYTKFTKPGKLGMMTIEDFNNGSH